MLGLTKCLFLAQRHFPRILFFCTDSKLCACDGTCCKLDILYEKCNPTFTSAETRLVFLLNRKTQLCLTCKGRKFSHLQYYNHEVLSIFVKKLNNNKRIAQFKCSEQLQLCTTQPRNLEKLVMTGSVSLDNLKTKQTLDPIIHLHCVQPPTHTYPSMSSKCRACKRTHAFKWDPYAAAAKSRL